MGVLSQHSVTPEMLDRLEAERVSHAGESHQQLVARLRRTEATGSLHDIATRISIGHAADIRTRDRTA